MNEAEAKVEPEKWQVLEVRSGKHKWFEVWKGTYTLETVITRSRLTWMTRYWAQRKANALNRQEAASRSETRRVVG